MRCYCPHSRDLDYALELYRPIRESDLFGAWEIVFPYEQREHPEHSRSLIRKSDLIIAEVSYPSTGLGIELGWANADGIPVFCIAKTGMKISRSLSKVAVECFEYANQQEMVEIFTRIFSRYDQTRE